MTTIFIDTNIVLNILLNRAFKAESLKILALATKEGYSLCISALSYMNIHYQLKKKYTERECRELIAKSKKHITTIDLHDLHIDKALISEFKDFEDAVQYNAALYAQADCIITRNKKDFKKSVIKVLTPTEYLAQLSQ
ncbi:PIN domain-containing protein [Flavimarina sp. Hel_I_48]|uniref:PIN domain-containing protein n=1 Tax=Flavimarina sp. Hel_I_48 TaxID=1392488 RepID=UPI0004DFB83C|nr:PIN domain-containing protein [Flavimarina sp. Hel_I_48]